MPETEVSAEVGDMPIMITRPESAAYMSTLAIRKYFESAIVPEPPEVVIVDDLPGADFTIDEGIELWQSGMARPWGSKPEDAFDLRRVQKLSDWMLK